MQVSAELRWFWKNVAPVDLEEWFRGADRHPCAAGGGARLRVDKYLRESTQTELGLKIRGDKEGGVEVKGLVSERFGELLIDPFTGPIEVWTKWTAKTLELESRPLILTEKLRWLRKFETTGASPKEIHLNDKEKPSDGGSLPDMGCNVELTKVRLSEKDESWWTLGFESFGSIRTVEQSLRTVATEMSNRHPPKLIGGLIASYPAWLSVHA
jgi:hypothetical protein